MLSISSLRNIRVLAGATFTEVIRQRALWGILGLACIMTMSNLIFTTMFSWDLGKVSIEFGLSAVSFTGLLLIFFLGLKIMADDLERSRIYMILSRPVTIGEYIFGKYCGLAMILLVATVILGISAAISMHYVLWKYPGYVPPGFSWKIYIMALACQWISLLIIQALCFFWFSFASHSFIALILAALSYIVGQNMENLRYVIEKNPQAGFLSGREGLIKIIPWIVPNLSLFDKKHVAAYGLAFSFNNFFIISCYGISYTLLLIIFSIFLYQRKELAA